MKRYKNKQECKALIRIKKDFRRSLIFLNGADDSVNFEPKVNYIAEFLHLCLHDEDTIEQVKEFLINCND